MILTHWISEYVTDYQTENITGTMESLEFGREEDTLVDILVSY